MSAFLTKLFVFAENKLKAFNLEKKTPGRLKVFIVLNYIVDICNDTQQE